MCECVFLCVSQCVSVNTTHTFLQCNNYDPMYSVTAMIDQLNWQKLENHRNNYRLCLLFKIMQQQIHVPTDDIPPPAHTTITRSSHERNLL